MNQYYILIFKDFSHQCMNKSKKKKKKEFLKAKF